MDVANAGDAAMTTLKSTVDRAVSRATTQRETEPPVRRRVRARRSLILGLIGIVALSAVGLIPAEPAAADDLALGRELFARKWLPKDPRCHGGDGLGPVYNATSCLDCHCLGGPGGAGPASRNVALATPIGYAFCSSGNFPTTHTMRHPILSDLVRIHPGFQSTRSIVLHRFGVDPAYSRWRNAFEITRRDQGVVIPNSAKSVYIDLAPMLEELNANDWPKIRGVFWQDGALLRRLESAAGPRRRAGRHRTGHVFHHAT